MSATPPAAASDGAPGWLLNATFAATLALAAHGIYAGLASRETGFLTFWLGLVSHLLVSLYHGRFGRLRTATWLLLTGSWALSVAIGFFADVLPWGQISFWLATHLSGRAAWLDELLWGAPPGSTNCSGARLAPT